ncbi:MAG: permease [Theionarchaea archaeon]|nr:permease [Theionarchaea archaeon]MBU6999328.1 permease [Theionarchaea archaeon]MBU7019882.1 permease [Theionarchaea archaeon]MBU7035282.1 permease [Theionarchaea archaeon]MBU7040942.1 permease [Theionarchaea archaeon]
MTLLEAGALELLEYLQAHVVTCLVPAFFIAGAIAVFISKQSVLTYFGAQAKKYVSYPVASVSGCILAACSCTVIPLFAGIYRRGAGIGPATAFLYSGPAINILAIVFTARVLGFEVGLVRAVLAIVMAVVIGLIMAFLYQKEDRGSHPQSRVYSEPENAKYKTWVFFVDLVLILVVGASTLRGVIKWPVVMGLLLVLGYVIIKWQNHSDTKLWLTETWQLSKLIVPYLLVGVVAAGIIKQVLPPAYVSRFVGGNSVSANVTASVAGALMYFATLTEVPIVESLMSLGMGKGPQLALLLAGPALSLPNMLAIRQVLGTQKTLTYVGLVIICASLSGILYGGI